MERVQFPLPPPTPPSCNIEKILPCESWISGFLKFVYEFIHNFSCNSVYNDKQPNQTTSSKKRKRTRKKKCSNI